MDEMALPSMIMKEKVVWEETPIKEDEVSRKIEEDTKKGINRSLNQYCASSEAEEDTITKNKWRTKVIDRDIRNFHT